jgi:hypothetical protein
MGEQPQWSKGPAPGNGQAGTGQSGQAGSGGPGWGQPGSGQPRFGAPPPGQLTPADERTWALAAHLSGLVAAFFFVGFLGPLVVMLVQGPRSAFVRRHAVEALNFWLMLFVLSIAGIVFGFLTLGLGFFIVVPVGAVVIVAAVVMSVLAAVAATNGQDYRYPVNLRLVK